MSIKIDDKDDFIARRGYCHICHTRFIPVLTVHHIEPLCYGGDDCEKNSVVMCVNCCTLVGWYEKNLPKNWKGEIDPETKPVRDQVKSHFRTWFHPNDAGIMASRCLGLALDIKFSRDRYIGQGEMEQ